MSVTEQTKNPVHPRNSNFRAAYLTSLGFKNSRNFLDNLLKESFVDVIKLRKATEKLDIHPQHRYFIWMLLFGILPEQKDAREFVQQQRIEQYNDLKSTTKLFRRGIEEKLERTFDLNEVEQSIVAVYCTQRHYCDHRLFNNKEEEEDIDDIFQITSTFYHVCQNEADTFWCLNHLLRSRQGTDRQKFGSGVTHQVNVVSMLLESREYKVFQHLQEHKVSVDHFAKSWLKCYFAGYLPRDCVLRIWDKIIGVSPDMAPCVVLVLLHLLRNEILEREDAKSIVKLLTKLPNINSDILIVRTQELFDALTSEKKV